MGGVLRSFRRLGLGANPWWIALMLLSVVLANWRFGDRDSQDVGSWLWSPLAVTFVVVALLPAVLPSRTLRDGSEIPGAPPRLWALTWVVMALGSFALGSIVYGDNAPALKVIDVELGGSAQTLPDVDLSAALSWDFALIVAYGTALWMATTAATWVFWTPRAARIARLARWLTVLAVLCDMAENVLLGCAWTGLGQRPFLLDVAAVMATIKFSVLLPAALIGLVGVLVVVGRIAASVPWPWLRARERVRWDWRLTPDTLVDPAPLELDGSGVRHEKRVDLSDVARSKQVAYAAAGRRDVLQPPGGGEQRWKSAYNVPDISIDTDDRDPGSMRPFAVWCNRVRRTRSSGAPLAPGARIGFCLSGGGVRSASFAMGFLQATRSQLRRAKYLVSISGGGYTSGALALLLTSAPGPDQRDAWLPQGATVVRDADTAYMPGTVEFDHLRRHSSYISASVSEMLGALLVVARGLIASLVVLFAPAVALGVFLAWIYLALPLSVLPAWNLPATTTDTGVLATTNQNSGLMLPTRDVNAVLVVGGLTLILWLLKIVTQDARGRFTRWLHAQVTEGAPFASLATLVVAILTVGLPVLMWVTRWLGDKIGVTISVGSSVGVVMLSYIASLASLLWRKRTQLSSAIGDEKGKKPKTAAVPRGLLQLLLVIAALGVLCSFWLLLLGAAALAEVTALADEASAPSVLLGVAIVVVVFVIGAVFDQSSLSLHPFYRRRLASAFATRRLKLSADAPAVSVPYQPREGTKLSIYGDTAQDEGSYPEVIFAAAANLTGEHRTPSGLSAVSFVMSATWCGGPDIGWVRTSVLEGVSPPRLQRDLTVQAAMAISGAAFASAMGRFARWYQLLLAVTGARLGAWLPNPMFLAQMRLARDNDARVTDWTLPGLPRVRRLTYLLREVFNLHSASDRLLEVTDGGHYENLGIVELLRRRCTTIYCVDGGGDSPPTAQGLAEAMALAKSELGVTITLNEPWTSEPGSGKPLTPEGPLAVLSGTLSQTPIITGTFTYPEAAGLPSKQEGRLFVARALLTPDMPYELLSYAAKHPEFPHDSTSDQWFDDGQFNAYTELGRELGRRIVALTDTAGPRPVGS